MKGRYFTKQEKEEEQQQYTLFLSKVTISTFCVAQTVRETMLPEFGLQVFPNITSVFPPLYDFRYFKKGEYPEAQKLLYSDFLTIYHSIYDCEYENHVSKTRNKLPIIDRAMISGFRHCKIVKESRFTMPRFIQLLLPFFEELEKEYRAFWQYRLSLKSRALFRFAHRTFKQQQHRKLSSHRSYAGKHLLHTKKF